MPWIVGAISRANKAHSSDGVRRPEGVTNKIADVRRAKAKLADAAGFVRSEDVARELGITMAELSDEQKDAISHRGRAARALLKWLKEG